MRAYSREDYSSTQFFQLSQRYSQNSIFSLFDPFKHRLRMDHKAFMLGSPLTLIDKEESNTTQEDPQFPGDLSEVS